MVVKRTNKPKYRTHSHTTLKRIQGRVNKQLDHGARQKPQRGFK